ncbi:MAG: condensation domain-containing protein [Bacteroidota bacterium]
MVSIKINKDNKDKFAINYLNEIPVAPDAEHYEMSRMQLGHWLMHTYVNRISIHKQEGDEQVDDSWNQSIIQTLPFFDLEIGRRALETIVERHDLLRTTYITVDGHPRQVVHPLEHFKDAIKAYKDDRHSDVVMTELEKESKRVVFDPIKGPLFYAKLVQAKNEYIFIIVLDHSITDEWSNGILREEIYEVYQAYRQNKPNPLQPLRIRYKDFTIWHNRLLRERAPEHFRQYWHRFTNELLPKTDLSTHFATLGTPESYRAGIKKQLLKCFQPMPPAHEELVYGNLAKLEFKESGAFQFGIGKQVYRGLKKRAIENDTSLFNVINFVIQCWIYRVTGSKDSVLGVNMVMRQNDDLTPMMGFMLNTVLVRNQVITEDTVNQNIQRITGENLDATELVYYSFERVLNDLDLPFENVCKIFVNMINKENSSKLMIKNFKPHHLDKKVWYSYFDLDFHVAEEKNGILIVWEYGKHIFTPEQVDQLYTAFMEVAEILAFQPTIPLEEAMTVRV